MPTYEYECQSCAHVFELFQRITSEPVADCPRCGKPSRRMISGGQGIIFKGSGFYLTDYNKSGSASAAPAPSGEKKTGTDGGSKDGAPAAPTTPVSASASPRLGAVRARSAAAAPSVPQKSKSGEVAKKAAVRGASKTAGKSAAKKAALKKPVVKKPAVKKAAAKKSSAAKKTAAKKSPKKK